MGQQGALDDLFGSVVTPHRIDRNSHKLTSHWNILGNCKQEAGQNALTSAVPSPENWEPQWLQGASEFYQICFPQLRPQFRLRRFSPPPTGNVNSLTPARG